MNRWKFLAIVLFIFLYGAIQETVRILTSADKDIANNRARLIPMSLSITAVIAFFAIKFWRKGSKTI